MSSHRHLDLPNRIFPSGLPTNTLYAVLSNSCCMLRLYYHPWFNHSDNIWRGVEIMKLLIMKFSPVSCYVLSLSSWYIPQYRIPKPDVIPSWFIYWSFVNWIFYSGERDEWMRNGQSVSRNVNCISEVVVTEFLLQRPRKTMKTSVRLTDLGVETDFCSYETLVILPGCTASRSRRQ
jgi:hypothetical protein